MARVESSLGGGGVGAVLCWERVYDKGSGDGQPRRADNRTLFKSLCLQSFISKIDCVSVSVCLPASPNAGGSD